MADKTYMATLSTPMKLAKMLEGDKWREYVFPSYVERFDRILADDAVLAESVKPHGWFTHLRAWTRTRYTTTNKGGIDTGVWDSLTPAAIAEMCERAMNAAHTRKLVAGVGWSEYDPA